MPASACPVGPRTNATTIAAIRANALIARVSPGRFVRFDAIAMPKR